jgi:protein-L-isoaspartate(D-aspartate) O-methyltransferase
VQRLLAVLAAGKRCAEMGTAFGEGAAAIASTAASLVTVEHDARRAAVARKRLAGLDNVELLEGDWRDLLPQRAPFELLFLDSGDWKDEPYRQRALDLVEPGGLLIKDDMTPGFPGPDPLREWFFGHPDLIATEVLTTTESAAIIATKRR